MCKKKKCSHLHLQLKYAEMLELFQPREIYLCCHRAVLFNVSYFILLPASSKSSVVFSPTVNQHLFAKLRSLFYLHLDEDSRCCYKHRRLQTNLSTRFLSKSIFLFIVASVPYSHPSELFTFCHPQISMCFIYILSSGPTQSNA